MRLGIKPDSKSSLLESVEGFSSQRREKEIELYGHVRTKEEILEEIKEVDARLNELREQDPELYDRNPSKQQILEEIEMTNQEIAQLEREQAQVAERIAMIRAQKGLK
jgi:chromosome segregation ATPase